MTWHCAQIGAREHYAIPRALHREERLGRLYTDFWAGSLLRHIGPAQWRGRFHEELAEAPVSRFLVRSLIERLRPAPKNCYNGFLETGRAFSRAVARRLPKGTMADQIFFAYDTGFLEAAETARCRGAKAIVDNVGIFSHICGRQLWKVLRRT